MDTNSIGKSIRTACLLIFGAASLALSPASLANDEETLVPTTDTTVPFWVVCTSRSQLCTPPYNATFETGEILQVQYTVTGHCSSLRVRILVDGSLRATSQWLGWVGGTGPYGSLPLSTGFLDVGPVSAGTHVIGVQGEGQVAGCNTGILSQWGGNLTVRTSPLPIAVPVDIKPGSCPNPLNTNSHGVLPAAVLGASDFDAASVDPASIRLVGVAPLRSSREDVATPFVPYLGKKAADDCTTAGPDGFPDLTLKFRTAEIVAALEDQLGRELEDGEVLVLPLTGVLLPSHGGTPIVGEDVVVVHVP